MGEQVVVAGPKSQFVRPHIEALIQVSGTRIVAEPVFSANFHPFVEEGGCGN